MDKVKLVTRYRYISILIHPSVFNKPHPTPRSIYIGLNTRHNQVRASKIVSQINHDISSNNFDSSLHRYKITKPLRNRFPNFNSRKTNNLKILWEDYTQFKKLVVSESTLRYDFQKISNVISKLPTQNVNDVLIIREYLLENYSVESAKRILKQFSYCCQFHVDHKRLDENSFKHSFSDLRGNKRGYSRQSFLMSELVFIFEAFSFNVFLSPNSFYLHSYYTNMVKFAFYTGARIQETIALEWDDIDWNRKILEFNKAYRADLKLLKSTKNRLKRRFPLNDDLYNLLVNHRANNDHKRLVFPSPKGGYIDPHNFLTRIWKPIITSLVSNGSISTYLPFYNTRHTFISYCLDNGLSPTQVASLTGTSPSVIYKHYASYSSLPNIPSLP